jgi:NADH-quinone oxidoreductase subunit L
VLVVLAAGSILAGYAGVPHALGGSNRIERFLEPSFAAEAEAGAGAAAGREESGEGHDDLELSLMGVSTLIAFGGIGIATFFFLWNRRAADQMALRFSGLHRLLANKYYVDEFYDAAVVQPIRIASEEGLWKVVDAGFIDGSVNGVATIVSGSSELLRRMQSGSVRVYAASVMLGVVVIVGYYVWR